MAEFVNSATDKVEINRYLQRIHAIAELGRGGFKLRDRGSIYQELQWKIDNLIKRLNIIEEKIDFNGYSD